MRRIYAYLRASTKAHNSEKAKEKLVNFASQQKFTITAFFKENSSDATLLGRPELDRLIEVAIKGDIILVESVDRLTKLKKEEWRELKSRLDEKSLRVVSIDMPTSYAFIPKKNKDDFTQRIEQSISSMMLEMLAAVAREDNETRQISGIDQTSKPEKRQLKKG